MTSLTCRPATSTPTRSCISFCHLLPQAVEDCHTRHDEMRALPAPREMSESSTLCPAITSEDGASRLCASSIGDVVYLSLPSRSFPSPRLHRNLALLLFPFFPPQRPVISFLTFSQAPFSRDSCWTTQQGRNYELSDNFVIYCNLPGQLREDCNFPGFSSARYFPAPDKISQLIYFKLY